MTSDTGGGPSGGQTSPTERIAGLDTSVAHPARAYDYWLGGKDNFAADREAAERVLAVTPGLRWRVRANRAFLGRATRFLAANAGIRRFLDIGTGIPTGDNTHEVAQRAAPAARVVYVDSDPIVLLHTQALLRSTPEGVTDYLQADLRDPGLILDRAAGVPPRSRWPGSAPGSTWSSRAWCRSTSGGPTAGTSFPPVPSPHTAPWGANPARHDAACY